VGAKVTARVGTGSQTIHIGAQPSYLSQSASEAHFGLGAAERVDEVVVVFPNGARVVQKDVPARQRLVVSEESR